ncbi:MAG TPA: C4-type zinc ribbon domain-containing protein [Anaerolineae bacterium]|nr:C4-type zinc ribbon domain-containing protein [Anaerolineae bacterium]HOR00974.1 C4-type zinc ribbon domain-containing protein [Anaerolineae bacterium]HPL30152.1 C4-type zinc ribbon domain-containing protein [Anaerolineae bacterium]
MPGLQTVYQLQTAELERADAVRRLREAEQAIGESGELRGAREALQVEEARLSRLRARVRDLELEVKGLTSRIAEGEQRLYGGTVRNPKELESLQEDLRQLRGRRDGLEDSILQDLTEIDESEARLALLRPAWEAVQAAWQAQQRDTTEVVAKLRAQLVRLDEQTAHLRSVVPPDLLEQYDDLRRKKGGRGIAVVRNGLCEACRVQVPTRLVQQVRSGDEVYRCGNCGRILCVA